MSRRTSDDLAFDFVKVLAERIGLDTENEPIWQAWNRYVMAHNEEYEA